MEEKSNSKHIKDKQRRETQLPKHIQIRDKTLFPKY